MPSGAMDDCGNSPTVRANSLGLNDANDRPSNVTSPAAGRSSRDSERSRVDLPQAFGPMITVNSSPGTSTLNPVLTTRWS